MNCSDANKMNIAGFLMSKGINPDKTLGKSFWYCSPIRNEHTPSFKVDRDKNLWYDFGSMTGGTLIDLVCKMYLVEVPGALLILSGVTTTNYISFIDRRIDVSPEPGIEIKHIQPLKHKALFQYLISRKVNPIFASRYCVEATYKLSSREMNNFAIGFKNDRGGGMNCETGIINILHHRRISRLSKGRTDQQSIFLKDLWISFLH